MLESWKSPRRWVGLGLLVRRLWDEVDDDSECRSHPAVPEWSVLESVLARGGGSSSNAVMTEAQLAWFWVKVRTCDGASSVDRVVDPSLADRLRLTLRGIAGCDYISGLPILLLVISLSHGRLAEDCYIWLTSLRRVLLRFAIGLECRCTHPAPYSVGSPGLPSNQVMILSVLLQSDCGLP